LKSTESSTLPLVLVLVVDLLTHATVQLLEILKLSGLTPQPVETELVQPVRFSVMVAVAVAVVPALEEVLEESYILHQMATKNQAVMGDLRELTPLQVKKLQLVIMSTQTVLEK
jgi:hypothetical protein